MKIIRIERTNIPFIETGFLSHVKWVTEDDRVFHQGRFNGDDWAVFEQRGAWLTRVPADSALWVELDAAVKYYSEHLYDALGPTV